MSWECSAKICEKLTADGRSIRTEVKTKKMFLKFFNYELLNSFANPILLSIFFSNPQKKLN